ncbi:MAG: hypothetical protein PVG75_00600 [Thioalkalispiraceae bacterium]|jgi:hypothetical protein
MAHFILRLSAILYISNPVAENSAKRAGDKEEKCDGGHAYQGKLRHIA